MIFVDSNVIVDITSGDSSWQDWSLDQIMRCGSADRLVINEIIVAEVAPSMPSLDEFFRVMQSIEINLEHLSGEAAFVAGVAFREYRKRREGAKSVLPDFLIGGHASTARAAVLTRDPRFYRGYFPDVALIAPGDRA